MVLVNIIVKHLEYVKIIYKKNSKKRYINSIYMSTCLKMIVLGDACTGKTSFVTYLRDNVFNSLYSSTIGVDFIKLNINRHEKDYKIYLWDTAGQEKFDFLLPLYYRNLSALIAFYDVTDATSFRNLDKWIDKFRRINKDENIPIIIVGNKIDMQSNRCVSYESLISYANARNYFYTECSVKNNINLEIIFHKLIDDLSYKITTKQIIPSNDNGIKIESKSYFNLTIEDEAPKKKKISDKCCIIS